MVKSCLLRDGEGVAVVEFITVLIIEGTVINRSIEIWLKDSAMLDRYQYVLSSILCGDNCADTEEP